MTTPTPSRIRPEVRHVVAMGPLPASEVAEERDLDLRVAALRAIAPPLTPEEGAALLGSFGPDDCFGIAWTLLHLVETTVGGAPIKTAPGNDENEWLQRLWARKNRR